jgi:hypothetical protein
MKMQYDPEAIRQAMKLAQTPEGQQLIQMLRSSGGADLQTALNRASSGDYTAAKQAISEMLKNPEAQRLIQQMGGNYGSNGR